MRTTFTAHHNEHVSIRSFEEVVRTLRSAVGYLEDTGFAALLASTKNAEEFEEKLNPAKARVASCVFSRSITGLG